MATVSKPAANVDISLQDTPVSGIEPFYCKASKLDSQGIRRDTPVPNRATGATPQPRYVPHSERTSTYSNRTAHDWSPGEVVQWMRDLGFEDDIVRKFFFNDISGSILLELQSEDLKELDIMSFGKRHRVMSSIQSLRNSSIASGTAPSSSRSSSVDGGMASTQRTSTVASSKSYRSCSTATDEENTSGRPRRRRQHSSTDVKKRGDIRPGDSVSIVAIEQLLPKMHRCSKGEACRKWQKQQAKLARIAQDLPIESFGNGAIVAGDPGNPKTAPNLLKSPTKSDTTPSIVASSDAMGAEQTPTVQLSEERLKEVKSRNPQQNVLQFLKLQNQNLGKLHTVHDPATPPKELFPFPGADSPDSAKITPTLAQKIGQLPRLAIPRTNEAGSSIASGNMSAQRTVTPSVLSKRGQFYSYEMTAVPGGEQTHRRGTAASPGDFYRLDPSYRLETETPFSETDAPMTAIPVNHIPREDSQSVPPDMRFGDNMPLMEEPVVRSASTKPEHYWRQPSTESANILSPLKEGRPMDPIETPDDLRRTRCVRSNGQSLPAGYGQSDATHSGWMRMRKTHKLVFHEWEKSYFKLNGTELARHASDRDSKALQYIDVDDYAVACSSLASCSKLTAAFRKSILKHKDNGQHETAFGFSLIPASSARGSTMDRKALFLNSGKSHHFTVNSRDERIDWMRELMLAKALKRGRDTGAAVNINGSNMI